MTALVYFAVPIDGVRRETELVAPPWIRVRKAIRGIAATTPGVVGYHPRHAFTVGPDAEVVVGLERANRGALAVSDGLVALLPAGVASVGVPREVEYARSLGLPVAVVTDMTRSFSLADVPQFPVTMPGLRAAAEFVRDEAALRTGQATLGHRELAVYRADPWAKAPTRAHAGDAGYDLYTSEEVTIPPGGFVDVQTGLCVAMPPGLWGRIVGRSSTFRKRSLLVLEGVIDSGYRGRIYTGVTNLSNESITIAEGERVAQFIPHANVAHHIEVREVEHNEFYSLPHDGRGASGFGSSGS